MKFISWNVNGIRAAWSHGLSAFLHKTDADIYAFQETKASEEIPMVQLQGYEAYWSFCSRKKGYSGTLCLTKHRPISVRYDLGDKFFDTEGRIITLEFENLFFVNCYVPNAQSSEYRRDYRAEWDARLPQYVQNLSRRKPTVVCGDFNVPISDSDIYAENKWVELNQEGFQSSERESLLQIVQNGFVDSYRLLHLDEEGKYTWWSNRRYKRKENRGWRLDYFFVSEKLKESVRESTMYSDVYGSDHCPILLDIDYVVADQIFKARDARTPHYTYSDLLRIERDYVALQNVARTDMTELWNSIDWSAAEEHLKQMQMSLAKAAYSRNWDKIAKWQKQIVYSIDAKLLAVRHVCGTSGGPGIDGIKWHTPHDKMSAAISLTSYEYRALPARLLLMRGKNGKQRRIRVETYFDRAMQTLYAYALDPVSESWADRKSFAFRKGRSALDLNEYIKTAFSGEDAPQWAFIGDVHKCYESISHEWIMKHIPMSIKVLTQFLKAGYVFAGELFPTDEGVGVGCSISPIIANMTLDGMQDSIYSYLYPDGIDIDYRNGNLLRYADDFIVAAKDEETAKRIKRCVSAFLEERGLELSEDKCRIVRIEEGFTFMSRTYAKRGNQFYAVPSQRAVERFMETLKDTIESYSGSQKSLIATLNKKIDGWVTYHKVTEADDAFRMIDVYINALLLELCERKHPKWSRDKILQRYWYVDEDGRHCYALPKQREYRVKFLADALLVDHYAVRMGLNPYIELDYYERRTQERQILSVTGVFRSIWNRQDGRCFYCGSRILRDEAKSLVEVDASEHRKKAQMAYVHTRCLDSSLDYVDTDLLPSSVSDVMELLERLAAGRQQPRLSFAKLSEFFYRSEKPTLTLTFGKIEEIMGEPLGLSARRSEFWYRTGFATISQCWLEHGYEIAKLHLEGKRRVVFRISSDSRQKAGVRIPDAILYTRVPIEAKRELEHFFRYITEKYAL